MRKLLLNFSLVLLNTIGITAAQNITVNTGVTATVLVNSLVDPSVTVSNITQSCKNAQRGTFANGSALGISNGIILTSGNANDAVGPNAEGCSAESANTSVNGNY